MTPLNQYSRDKIRNLLRALVICIGIDLTFIAAVAFEKDQTHFAEILASGVILTAIFEIAFADWLVDSFYPEETSELLKRFQIDLTAHQVEIRERIAELIDSLKACDIEKVSGTVHLGITLRSQAEFVYEDALVQITDYSGKFGGRKWRFTRASQGLIGRCYRSGGLEFENFATRDEYDQRMVREYGYSKEEVKTHTQDARSYVAYPIFTDKLPRSVCGVIFLFSTEPQIFPGSVEESRLKQTAQNIAAYLRGCKLIG